MNSTTKQSIKRKPNDGYEPLTFRHDDVKKMTAKEQGEDLLRISKPPVPEAFDSDLIWGNL